MCVCGEVFIFSETNFTDTPLLFRSKLMDPSVVFTRRNLTRRKRGLKERVKSTNFEKRCRHRLSDDGLDGRGWRVR